MDMNIPPNSIAVNTTEILKTCENAEIRGVVSSSATASHAQSYILVTQLASLIFLKQYNHARHLWRRYKMECEGTANSDTEDNTNKTMREMDLYQFQLLWNAVQPLIKSYFGHNDNETNLDVNDDNSLLLSLTSYCENNNVYSSLQSCVDANLHPLSMYALELKNAVRDQIAELIEMVYDSIQDQKCYELLDGNGNGNDQNNDLDQYLLQRGWKYRSSNEDMRNNQKHWIPATPSMNVKKKSQNTETDSIHDKDKIKFLSQVVSFMEKQNMKL